MPATRRKETPVADRHQERESTVVAVGRRVEKRWGVIFTCLTVRAVHLEVAHTLSTGSCIAAVRRFIARRGVPREIISDCGTNFVGTARELRDAIAGVDHEALMTEFCSPELKWTFNPPEAPHFGGCWERLVRSVKKVLGHLNLPRRPTDEVPNHLFFHLPPASYAKPAPAWNSRRKQATCGLQQRQRCGQLVLESSTAYCGSVLESVGTRLFAGAWETNEMVRSGGTVRSRRSRSNSG